MTAKGPNIKLGTNYKLIEYIENGIKKKRKSPEILVEEIKRKSEVSGETICAKTIRNYIHKRILQLTEKDMIYKKEYKEKNKTMSQALKKYIPYPFYLDEAYLCYNIELHNINEDIFMNLCQKQNIAIHPIKNHILTISFASLPLSEINHAILQLSHNLTKATM